MIKDMRLISGKVLYRFGEGPCHEYRIPALTVTEKGTILIACEGRMAELDDWAAKSILMDRSTDGGKTWTRRTFLPPKGIAVNNPNLILDGDKIHFIFHSNYEIPWHCVSGDDGETWSEPEDISAAYREAPYVWTVSATGPGHGIRLTDGSLLIPVWLADGVLRANGTREHHPSVAGCVVSKDGGRTWHFGCELKGVNDCNETIAAQLPDGRVLFIIRNCENDCRRRLAWSTDGGMTVTPLFKSEDLTDPWCMGSAAVYGEEVLFCNCDSTGDKNWGPRVNLVIRASRDGGENWHRVCLVDEIGGYSDIAIHGNTLTVLYERTERGRTRALVLKQYEIIGE